MNSEIALGDGSEEERRNTGIRYEKRGPNFGMLEKDIYTVGQLAEVLGLHNTTILEQINRKRLKALYLGGPAGYRIHKDDIINWVRGLNASDPEVK